MEAAINTIHDGQHQTHTSCSTTSAQIKQQCNITQHNACMHAHQSTQRQYACNRVHDGVIRQKAYTKNNDI